MNQNALIAVLVRKGILTLDEGNKLAEHINNSPQSSQLADAIEQIREFIGTEAPKVENKIREESVGIMSKVSAEVKKVTDKSKK